jgi:ferritin-like metal-binding protein YciE
MKMNTLRDLYVEQLQDLYSAESQLVKALPKMELAASHSQLKQAFTQHLAQTEQHVERLEQIFQSLGSKPNGHTCRAMEGLIQESEEMIKMKGEPAVIDAGLIAAAQRVEHYEIAGYGTAAAYAEILGEQEAAKLLQETLDEESGADTRLTRLARKRINFEAMVATPA